MTDDAVRAAQAEGAGLHAALLLNDIEEWLRECVKARLGRARQCQPPEWAMRHLGRHDQAVLIDRTGTGGATGLPLGPGFASFDNDHAVVNAGLCKMNDPRDTIARCESELALLDGATIRPVLMLARAYRRWPGWQPQWDGVVALYLRELAD